MSYHSETKNLPKVCQTFLNLGLEVLGEKHFHYILIQDLIKDIKSTQDIQNILFKYPFFQNIMIELVENQLPTSLLSKIVQGKHQYRNQAAALKYFNLILNIIYDTTQQLKGINWTSKCEVEKTKKRMIQKPQISIPSPVTNEPEQEFKEVQQDEQIDYQEVNHQIQPEKHDLSTEGDGNPFFKSSYLQEMMNFEPIDMRIWGSINFSSIMDDDFFSMN